MLRCCRQRWCDTRLVLAVLLVGGITRAAPAHEGPPFPILMDESAGDYLISVWADPDIGEATFYVVVETATGEPPGKTPEIVLWTEPVSHRLERETYQAVHQPIRNRMQFQIEPYFDKRDVWTVGIVVADNDGENAELTAEIESTPPGMGGWGLLVYLFPFLLFGGLWARGLLHRRRCGQPDS